MELLHITTITTHYSPGQLGDDVSEIILLPVSHDSLLTRFCFYAQEFKSRKLVTVNGLIREQYNCLYRCKCDCYVAIAVRTFHVKVQFVSDEHIKDSHAEGRGILTVKQFAAVEESVRSAPLAVGSHEHANL